MSHTKIQLFFDLPCLHYTELPWTLNLGLLSSLVQLFCWFLIGEANTIIVSASTICGHKTGSFKYCYAFSF